MSSMKNKKVEVLPAPAGQWLRIEKAATYSGMGIKQLRNFSYAGEVPYHKVGKYCFYKMGDLDAFMEKKKVKVPALAGGRAK